MATRKWGSETQINTTTAGLQSGPAITTLFGGRYIIVWQDDSGPDARILGQMFEADGTRQGGELVLAASAGNDLINPAITAPEFSDFHLTYEIVFPGPSNDLLGSAHNSVTGAFFASRPVIFAPGAQTDSDMSQMRSGSVTVWTDSAGAIFARTFPDPVSGPVIFEVSGGAAGNEAHASVAGRPNQYSFLVAWEQDGTLDSAPRQTNAAMFNSEGTLQYDFSVAQNAYDPDVAWLDNDRAVVAYRENIQNANGSLSAYHSIAVRIFDITSKTELTGPIQVSLGSRFLRGEPVVAVGRDGSFVVAWADNSDFLEDPRGLVTNTSAIHLQAFDTFGDRMGGPMLVNTTTDKNQTDPSIVVLGDGRVVVSWVDFSSGSAEIMSQIVDPRDGIVRGSADDDRLYGNDSVNDEISGYGGNDKLFGLAGADVFYCGAGVDTANGGRGDDTAYGGTSNDSLNGNAGDDVLFGEDGDDTLRGGGGDDELFGGTGNDTLIGGPGADILNGGAGASDLADYSGAAASVRAALDATLLGTNEALGDSFAGIERLRGSDFADRLRGDAANNFLFGGDGKDTLEGQAGNDQMDGGLGADILIGGKGTDIFQYALTTHGNDSIKDFSAADDAFAFSSAPFGGLPIGVLAANRFQVGTDVNSIDVGGNVRFYFETDARILWFDADGVSGGSVAIATLQAGATMTAADVVIF